MTVQTHKARERRVRGFLETLDADTPLTEISKRDVGRFVSDKLVPLDRSLKTKRDALTDLTAFLNWAVDSGRLESNPAAGASRLLRDPIRGVERPERRAWTDAELAELLRHIRAELKPGDLMESAVLIAAYSGLRLNELTELRGRDIENGCFVIKQAKNTNSLRRVPIHSRILPLVDGAQSDYLIQGLSRSGENSKRGHEFSKRFGRYKRKWRFPAGVVFHGLRMGFAEKLEAAAVPVGVAELLLGHRRQSMSYGRYSKSVPVEILRSAVERIEYVGI